MPSINPLLSRVAAPPIGQAAQWASEYDGQYGPLIDLSQAVPGHAPAAWLAQAIGSASADPLSARYGPVLGDGALREVYAGEMSRLYNAPIKAAETAITSGCNQAFFVTAMALAKTGEAIVLPRPFYFNHEMTLDMLGIEVRALVTTPEQNFLPTVAGLEAVLDEKVRAVALVTPNNPTGAIYPPDLIAGIADVCRSRGIALILDETYRDFMAPSSTPPHSLFALPDWRSFLIELYSFSKSYAVPGHRLGAMVAGGDFLAEIAKVVDCVQICAPRSAQTALLGAFEATRSWRSEKTHEILERGDVFRRALEPLAAYGWRIEQLGAYFAYVRHPFEHLSAQTVAQVLARRLGIVVLPGTFFGPGQERNLRVAFANISSERIASLGHRLAEADAVFKTLAAAA